MENSQLNGLEIPQSSALVFNAELVKLPNKFRGELESKFIEINEYEFLGTNNEYKIYVSPDLAPISATFYKYLKELNPEWYGFTNGYDEMGNRLDLIRYFTTSLVDRQDDII